MKKTHTLIFGCLLSIFAISGMGCRQALRESPDLEIVDSRTRLENRQCKSLGEVRSEGRTRANVYDELQRQTRDRGGNVLWVEMERFLPEMNAQHNTRNETNTIEINTIGEAFRCAS